MGTLKPDVIQYRLSGDTTGEIALRREREDRASQMSTWSMVYRETDVDATRRVNRTFQISSWAEPIVVLMTGIAHLRGAGIEMSSHIKSEPSSYLGIDAFPDRNSNAHNVATMDWISKLASEVSIGDRVFHRGKIYRVDQKNFITDTSVSLALFWEEGKVTVHKVWKNHTRLRVVDQVEMLSEPTDA